MTAAFHKSECPGPAGHTANQTTEQNAPNFIVSAVSQQSIAMLREDDAVAATLAGHQAGQDVLDQIVKGCFAPDLLHARLGAVLDSGEPELQRAFCRVVQKQLERIGGAQ